MSLLLLFVIFISFIGLGIPDSVFGASWPAIYTEFGIPYTYNNFVCITVALCTTCSSVFSHKILTKFKTGNVTAFSTLLTAAGLLGFSFAPNIYFMILFSIPLGLGAGCIDSGLNNYVALHYKATHMNFLHCFYGVGVALSPFIMSFMLSGDLGWRGGYRVVFIIQLIIAVICLFSLPLWKKVSNNTEEFTETEKKVRLKDVVKIKGVKIGWFVFFFACGLEFTCGNWCTTFLVECLNLEKNVAAIGLTCYYAGLASGRLTAGFISTRVSPWNIIRIGLLSICIGIALIFLPLPYVFAFIAMFLIGFGIGPVFPNLTHLTPINYGKDNSPAVVGTQMAASNLGVMAAPFIFSLLAQYVSVNVFPYYVLIIFCALICSIFLLKQSLGIYNGYKTNKQKRS